MGGSKYCINPQYLETPNAAAWLQLERKSPLQGMRLVRGDVPSLGHLRQP